MRSSQLRTRLAIGARGCLAFALLVILSVAAANGDPRGSGDTEQVFRSWGSDASDGQPPKGEGVEVGVESARARLRIPRPVAWARATFSRVPRDIRRYGEVRVQGFSSTTDGDDLYMRLRDAGGAVASLRLGRLSRDETTLTVPLGDARAAPGFDPTQVRSLSLVWFKPKVQEAHVSKLEFISGGSGWRHSDRELARRVFGERRSGKIKHVASKHFDVWTDSSAVARTLPAQLEEALSASSSLLGLNDDDLDSYRLPVYVFKSAKEFRAYCISQLGWSKARATRSRATGSYWSIVMQKQGRNEEEIVRRVAKSVFQHEVGYGGGAWLLDGVGELAVSQAQKRRLAKTIASQIRSGTVWPLASLIAAEKLHSSTESHSADYRPVYRQAASLLAYLLSSKHQWGKGIKARDGESTTLRGMRALASVRSVGKARVAACEEILGETVAELDKNWREWVDRERR